MIVNLKHFTYPHGNYLLTYVIYLIITSNLFIRILSWCEKRFRILILNQKVCLYITSNNSLKSQPPSIVTTAIDYLYPLMINHTNDLKAFL